MSARTTRLVIEREIREAARRKAIWALVGLVFLASTAMVVVPELVSPDEGGTVMIVGDDRYGLADALGAEPDRDLEVTAGADREVARLAVADGDVDLAVVLDEQPPVLLVEDVSSALVPLVRVIVTNSIAATRLAELGIDQGDVGSAFVLATPDIEPIDVERRGREEGALGLTLVLYLLTVILTSQIANGVAIEKSNRVSEVLLAIVPPRSMLFGKVLGVGFIGVATLLIGTMPVIVRLAFGADLPEDLGRTIAVSAVWFVGGLMLFLTLAGAMGALVERQEEVGAIVAPVTMLLVVGYLVSISAAESPIGVVCAYLPLTSPMVEPYRIAIGASSPFEAVGSLAVLVATNVVVARLATVVFRRAIVRTGRRLRLREVLASPAG